MKIEKGLYRHYKSNMYEVFTTAQHSETQEWVVVYKALYGDYGMWVRFTEEVEMNGVMVPRFQKINN